MTFYFYLFMGLVGLLFLLLLWSLRKPRRSRKARHTINLPEECGCRHVAHLRQIRQALSKEDHDFVSRKGSPQLERRVRRERRRAALAYLEGLREDFRSLLDLAKTIAVLSPEVAAVQEWEKLRLTLNFVWRFELLRICLWAGFALMPQVSGLANVVSGLSVRIERAMKELGERAAMTSELASALHRGGIDTV